MTKEKCNKGEQCVMCLMPKKSDDGVRENKNFCSYCFRDGKVCFEGNKKELNVKLFGLCFYDMKCFV